MRLVPADILLSSLGVGRFTTALLLALLLAGCSQLRQNPDNNAAARTAQASGQLVDFQRVDCEKIWTIDEDAAINNPLYWLQAMACGSRLSPADARATARAQTADSWQSVFRQAVLLGNGNVTPLERRQYLLRLDGYRDAYPVSIRPLLLLWREGQGSQLQLSAERMRYALLQQRSDNQLDVLRQQQIMLNDALTLTRRKLASLTDIERQLSSRRLPDASDGGQDGDKNSLTAPESAAPAGSTSQDNTNP